MRGLVVAGTHSGVGKTVTTLALLRAFDEAGRAAQPAKASPDFIDPSHHQAVAGRPSRTLDLWLQGEAGLRRNYARGEGDVCVVEGVMGLYDGEESSTAAVAAALDLPVVIVVDASAGMESVAATALGFREYAAHAGSDVDVAGVVAGRAHGGRHEAGIREALPDGLRYFGRVPPSEDLSIPDRHLGLHMGEEAALDADALDAAGTHLDVAGLYDLAREPTPPAGAADDGFAGAEASAAEHEDLRPADAPRPRVAVARDSAFCFSYPATLERLRARADVVTFSPVAGDPLPDCDGVYLPGGYPERHAERLESGGTLADIAAAASDGRPTFGECGGLMALCESLSTVDGDAYEMAGVLPGKVTVAERYQALEYVELRATAPTLTAGAGETRRGHEFHYSRVDAAPDARFAFDVERGDGIDDERDGLTEYRTLGTYCHVHPASGAFDAFVDSLP